MPDTDDDSFDGGGSENAGDDGGGLSSDLRFVDSEGESMMFPRVKTQFGDDLVGSLV